MRHPPPITGPLPLLFIRELRWDNPPYDPGGFKAKWEHNLDSPRAFVILDVLFESLTWLRPCDSADC